MPDTIDLTINGEKQQVASDITVANLLEQKNIEPQKVVVEINLDIIPRETYSSHTLSAEDTVEILHFVGGG